LFCGLHRRARWHFENCRSWQKWGQFVGGTCPCNIGAACTLSLLLRGITYKFTHWGVERSGIVSDASIPWRNFTRLKETKHFFLLYGYETKVETFEVI
jgi:hypothetical protein